MLGEERRDKILQRVSGLLREIDADVHLHEVVLDSTRQQLVFVMQKGEWPIVVGMNWLEGRVRVPGLIAMGRSQDNK